MKKKITLLTSIISLMSIMATSAYAEIQSDDSVLETNCAEDFCTEVHTMPESESYYLEDSNQENSTDENAVCQNSENDFLAEYENSDITDYFIDAENASEDVAAKTHRHTYQTSYTRLNNSKKHLTTRKCTGCGYVSTSSQQNHTFGSGRRYNSKDGTYHYTISTCTKCGETVAKEEKHLAGTNYTYTPINETYHNRISTCRKCNGTVTFQQKHTLIKGKCSKCNYSAAQGVTAATRDKSGVCSIYFPTFGSSYDAHVYANCPKCGSSSWTFDYRQLFKKHKAGVGGWYNIYHQHVICNNCKKKYTNRCYDEKCN